MDACRFYIDDRQVSQWEFNAFLDEHDVGYEEGVLPEGPYYFKIHTEEVVK